MLREKNWENFTEYNPLIFIPEILCFIDIEQKKRVCTTSEATAPLRKLNVLTTNS